MASSPTSRERWLARLALGLVLGGAALGPGCIIAAGGGDSNACGSLLSFSHVGAGDICYCDEGYTWENPEDEEDFDCERIPGKGGGEGACTEPYSYHAAGICYCEGGYKWCEPDDEADYTCCMDDAQDEASGTDALDTGSEGTSDESGGGGAMPDPADCTAENEGVSFCSNTEADGPEASVYWLCMAGAWVEMPEAGNESCVYDGYDFSYGCVDTGTAVEFLCGTGAGSACERDFSNCADGDNIDYCQYGKLTRDSCFRICTEDGDAMDVTYDHGFCDVEAADCFCCDMGTEGCPV
jgi:hypothetical protein